MQVRRFAALAALPVVTSLGLVACGQGGDDASESNPTAIVSIEIAEPQHLIPTNTNETSGSQVLAALFTPLVSYDEANKPVEDAAESISSTDNTAWTIKLKDGYTFHNGEKVTADSYINAWNYGAYAPNGQGNSYFFEKIAGYADLQSTDPDDDGPQTAPTPKANKLSGLAKVDDLTFTVTLTAPYVDFKTMLGYTAFYPLPPPRSPPRASSRTASRKRRSQRRVQDERHLAARRQDRGRGLRRAPGREAEDRGRRIPDLPAAHRGVRGRDVGQPGRAPDDPDREHHHRADRPG